MSSKKLSQSQINKLPAQYTFVDGKMVKKAVAQQRLQASINEWDYTGDITGDGTCDDDMLFATAKR